MPNREFGVTDCYSYAGEIVWKKSSLSGQNGNCVEVADLADSVIAVRDSKNPLPGSAVLRFSRADWSSFLSAARAGRFDPS
jgi:Domain of unknown function (DUF397)